MATKALRRPKATADREEWTHRIADGLEMTFNLQVEVVDAAKGLITLFLEDDDQTVVTVTVDLGKLER